MRKMKDSGVAWIGEIPEEWTLTKIGNAYDERNTKVSDKDYPPLSVTKQGILPQLETAAKTDNGDNRKLIRKNDFVINSRSDRRGSCGISEYDGSCSLINTVLKPRHAVDNRYYSFVFKSEPFADEFFRWGNGIVDDLWSTKWSSMKNIYIPCPPREEQEVRGKYLQEACEKIDTTSVREQALIDKLTAYKQSLITETVTKGMHPEAARKDSGVEWIGEIPAHWITSTVQHLHNGLTDGTHGTYQRYDSGRLLLSSKNVRENGLLITNEESYISEEDYQAIIANGFPKRGDVLLCCIGASIGRCTVYDNDEPIAFQRSVIFIRCGSRVIPRFLMYALKSENTLAQEQLLVNQSAQAGLYQGLVGQIRVPLPPREEQHEIVAFLDAKCAAIDADIARRRKLIERLSAYRRSLIYEVVTGKREVV